MIIRSKPKKCFVVWCKSGARPASWHGTQERAQEAADKLAARAPGHRYLVFSCVDKRWADA